MKVSEFDFNLPEELIAQEALADRTASRLLVLNRSTGSIDHSKVADLGQYFQAGDVLVLNNSRVLPARLLGHTEAGLDVEIFLLKRLKPELWEALARPGKKIVEGMRIVCKKDSKVLDAIVKEKFLSGKIILKILSEDPETALREVGHVPLPPYIKREDTPIDQSRYQTVYAKTSGSVAAPTAGLHFTPELLENIKQKGVEIVEITLHVGYGTFKPVRSEEVEEHTLDPEFYEISPEAADKINSALRGKRRVIAVGTTTTRTLEGAAHLNNGSITAGAGEINIFIYPGFKFQVISGLMTNFHLPKSSLLMLVSAFADKDMVLHAYNEAIKHQYRFYSYGDAMLII
ncbi:MAG TPA: tRNA preQ1(34) S-adenosylmethionine ribosyltransferase-isomerase QueA [Candidatus Binatia bacterium]|nr:tRNA preQ1(34) S-adenosylmethionine ribosyltransferase-isomerase QueA [Candidatus Binatia bacterium]